MQDVASCMCPQYPRPVVSRHWIPAITFVSPQLSTPHLQDQAKRENSYHFKTLSCRLSFVRCSCVHAPRRARRSPPARIEPTGTPRPSFHRTRGSARRRIGMNLLHRFSLAPRGASGDRSAAIPPFSPYCTAPSRKSGDGTGTTLTTRTGCRTPSRRSSDPAGPRSSTSSGPGSGRPRDGPSGRAWGPAWGGGCSPPRSSSRACYRDSRPPHSGTGGTCAPGGGRTGGPRRS